MAKATQSQPSLVDLLKRAGAADLADIDQQIAAKQAELDEATKLIGGELDALKVIRKVLDVKINGKPARAPRGAKKAARQEPVNRLPSTNGTGHHVDRDAAGITVQSVGAILKSCGPCSPYTIAKKLGAPATPYLVGTVWDRLPHYDPSLGCEVSTFVLRRVKFSFIDYARQASHPLGWSSRYGHLPAVASLEGLSHRGQGDGSDGPEFAVEDYRQHDSLAA